MTYQNCRGPRIPAETLRRFGDDPVAMLAHSQGGLWNASLLARSLGVDGKTSDANPIAT